MAQRHGLGRGLGALIRDQVESAPTAAVLPLEPPRKAAIDAIRANPLQPRKQFAQEALTDLVASIREHGVLQPLLVRRKGDGYELIAGERRLRAAQAAGLKEVPIIERDAGDADVLALALIENLQREDLNPVEEAEGYRQLAETFSWTQEQVATAVGKGRPTVANALRLLQLPPGVLRFLQDGALTTGHAKGLLALEGDDRRLALALRAVREGLSVRALEKLVAAAARTPRKPRVSREDMPQSHVTYVTERLQQHLGTAVRIAPSCTYANGRKRRGTIEIEYYTNEDLDRLLEVIGLSEL